MINTKTITLDTKLYHYYLDIDSVKSISEDSVEVVCVCKFLKNKFSMIFIYDKDILTYNKEFTRHISELSLIPFK